MNPSKPDRPDATGFISTLRPFVRRWRRRGVVFLILSGGAAVLPMVGAPHGAAQIPENVTGGVYEPHPEAEKAISRLLSPFCKGFMLSQCPAEPSLILRDSIHALALQGWNADALEAWMLGNHGEEYRAVPKRSGAGLMAWLLPPLGLIAGLGVVALTLRSFVRSRGPSGNGTVTNSALDQTSGGEGDNVAGAEPVEPLTPASEQRLREAIRDLEFEEDPAY